MFRAYSAERRDRAPLIETEDFRDEGARRFWDDYSPPYFGFKKGPNDTYEYTSETFALAGVKRYWDYWSNRISNTDPAHCKWSRLRLHLLLRLRTPTAARTPARSRASSGKVDAVRLPKEIYFAHRVIQTETPDLHILGHWTYPADKKTVKTIYVIANTPVRRTLRQRQEPRRQLQARLRLDLQLPRRRIRARQPEGRSASQAARQSHTQELTTAGPAAAIKLTPRTGPIGLQADGQDVAFIDVEVVDAKGQRCPTDDARIDFTCAGPAIWRGGYNSGKIDSTNNLYLNTELGINRVFVRSTLVPGTITITASRKGLKPAQAQIASNRRHPPRRPRHLDAPAPQTPHGNLSQSAPLLSFPKGICGCLCLSFRSEAEEPAVPPRRHPLYPTPTLSSVVILAKPESLYWMLWRPVPCARLSTCNPKTSSKTRCPKNGATLRTRRTEPKPLSVRNLHPNRGEGEAPTSAAQHWSPDGRRSVHDSAQSCAAPAPPSPDHASPSRSCVPRDAAICSRSATIFWFAWSRFPVGSSASRIGGLLISARAMHTRCCSPPESSLGRCASRSPSPTFSSAARASASSVMEWKYCASITFSSAVRYGIRWNCWKIKPILSARKRSSSFADIAATSTPSIFSVPQVGRSRQPSRFTSVLLPEPEGPVIATHSPATIENVAESSARTTPVRARVFARHAVERDHGALIAA